MVCFKSIYVNTYEIYVLDLKTKIIIYRYENQHLWEYSITSLFLSNYDFMIFSQKGIQLMTLCEEANKAIQDSNNTNWKIHSLTSFVDLKLERKNALLFTNYNNKLSIHIQQ